MKNPYETLGLKVTATQDEIKNAYRKLAKKFHPDVNQGNKEAEKNFKDLNAANEMIGTPEAKAKFDRGETAEQQYQAPPRNGPYYHQTQGQGARYSQGFSGGMGGSGIDEDLFESIFGGRGGARTGGRGFSEDFAGQDEQYQMEVDFKDSILGGEKEISLPNGKRLRVKIPAGIETGKKLRFAGQGGVGVGKGPAGDLFIEIKVKPSALFKRNGNHVEMEFPISFAEAILGGEVRVPTLDGSILLKIPPSISSGQKLRVAGKGVPAHGPEKAGDQHVSLKIITPPTVDEELKTAVKAWSERHPFQRPFHNEAGHP